MTIKRWWKVTLHYQGDLPLEEFAGILMAEGMQAVNLLSANQLEYYLEADRQTAQKSTDAAFLKNCCDIRLTEVIQENWVQKCRDLFKEVVINKLKIIPLVTAADRQEYKDPDAIYIIPGMGFGSGHHPTSQMIMNLMQNIKTPVNSVLDCGTGSGILSLAAAKLFNCRIKAFDNDPQAIINAAENIDLNNNCRVELSLNSVEEITGQYDLIVANLYLELLKKFKADFLRLMHNESVLIVSGITADQALELTEFYQDLILIEAQNQSGWCAYKFKRC